MSFAHLHLHTEYSLLDGLNRVDSLMEKITDNGMDSVAISDHGVMYGVTEFWMGAKEHGVKPIIGCEMYMAPKERGLRKPVNGIKYYHLLLLAQNQVGYYNLNRLVSLANTEGLYYKPRIDIELLSKYNEGLICTSACLAGPVARHVMRKEIPEALGWNNKLKTIFGKRYYLEIQRNGFKGHDDFSKLTGKEEMSADHLETIEQQMKVNQFLLNLGQEENIKVITTTDAHYLNKEDNQTQEVLFAIKDAKLLDDPSRRVGYIDTYVKTPEEMQEHFPDLTEVLDNTSELASSISEYDIKFDRVQPKYKAIKKSEEGRDAKDLLKEQVYEGAEEAYGGVSKELSERIDYELGVIDQKGYNDYFLVVSDIIKWARRQGIVVGVRGSVAGSVVAYCLDIINVEPIGWELYFERFLNPERPSPPDIDMDFQDDRRDEVVAYVEEKYGHNNVAAICAIGRMKTKAAIRDVARVMNIDLQIADKLSKMVHVIFGKVKKIEQMEEDDPEFARLINSTPELQELKAVVTKIEGMARHVSTHACGYLITPEEITNYVSVQYETGKNSGKIITQQEGAWIEELGLMKFDFLGLRNLTIIKNTIELVEKYHGVKIDTKKIPLDDKKTFELFGRGETIGVFQFESPPMQKYLRDLQPETLEDICFMVSAYRPGPMKYIPDYIDCRHGRKKPDYLIPEMKPIVEKTFGFAIYQEQVIKIAVDIAGYSMGAADLLRRAMGKKKMKIMKKEEPIFKKGVMKLGYDKDIANEIWNYLLPFADYGFNKAHGASYSLVAYWCAYLKAHYPIEFMTGLMHSDLEDSDRIAIDMAEARKLNYTILPPDINKSELYFTIEKKRYIRFGLGAIKNVGTKLVEEIVKERNESGKFKDFTDFVERLLPHKLSKKAAECLIKVGAFDNFGYRNQLLQIIEAVFEQAQSAYKTAQIGQADMFGNVLDGGTKGAPSANNSLKIQLPQLPDVETSEKILWEKELVGTYITAHPLDRYKLSLLNGDVKPVSDIANFKVKGLKAGDNVRVLAVLSTVKQVLTKKDNKPMAILNLEDQISKVDGVVFPRGYEELKDKLISGEAVVITGNLSERDDNLNIIVNEILPAKELNATDRIKIDIRDESSNEELATLKKKLALYKGGDLNLEVIYGDKFSPKKFALQVQPATELITYLDKYLVK